MNKEMLTALDILEKEKGISKEIVTSALEAALVSAYKRNYVKRKTLKFFLIQKQAIFMSIP